MATVWTVEIEASAEVTTPPDPAACVAQHPGEPCPGHEENA